MLHPSRRRPLAAGLSVVTIIVAIGVVACNAFSSGDSKGTAPPIDGGGDSSFDGTSSSGGNLDSSSLADGASGGAALFAPFTDAPVTNIAVGTGGVYWITSEGSFGGGLGSLYGCPKTGCPSGTPNVLSARVQTATLASDGTSTFASFAFGQNRVSKIEGNGLVDLPSVASLEQPNWLLPRGSNLYINNYGPGPFVRTILRTTKDGSSGAVAIATYSPVGAANTSHTVMTADRIFLGAHNVGKIVSCTLSNCPNTEWDTFLEGNAAYVASMASTDDAIVWTGGSTVLFCNAGASCLAPTELLNAAHLGTAKAQSVTMSSDRKTLYVITNSDDLLACDVKACASSLKTIAHDPGMTPPTAIIILAGHTVADDERAIYYAVYDTTSPTDGAAPATRSRIMRLAK
jgi:hypothetical protein